MLSTADWTPGGLGSIPKNKLRFSMGAFANKQSVIRVEHQKSSTSKEKILFKNS